MSKKLIWDLPTRLFHWALAILICGSYYTAEIAGDLGTHMLIGQTILVLVLFRIIWGFVGTRYARFASFVRGPAEIVDYARSLAGRGASGYAGHNPLGGAVVVLMLALVLAQVTSGLFATDGDTYAGPLNHLVSDSTGEGIAEFHEGNFVVLLVVVIVHVAAAFFYLLFKRENLIGAMITGRKTDSVGSYEPIAASRVMTAVVVLLAAAAAVYALVTLV